MILVHITSTGVALIGLVASTSNAFSSIGHPFHFTKHSNMSRDNCLKKLRPNLDSLKMVNEEDMRSLTIENSSSDVLKDKARRMKMEVEKMELELNLEKIAKLEKVLVASSKLDVEARKAKQKEIKNEIKALASRIDPGLISNLSLDFKDENLETGESSSLQFENSDKNIQKTESKPKSTVETNLYKNRVFKEQISEEDLMMAIEYFSSLPRPLRKALAKSIDLDESRANPAVIVLGLYELAETISSERLQQLYNVELETKVEKQSPKDMSTFQAAGNKAKALRKEQADMLNQMNTSDLSDALDVTSMVESFLPRVTRKEETAPSKDDVDFLINNVLGKESFQLSGKPEAIPGGFILRGNMSVKLKKDGDRLIELLDERVANASKEWNEKFQVSYMTDPTPQMLESEELNGSAVLVVHSRDMSPEPRVFWRTGITSISLFLAFVFGISTFGMNDTVMERLQSANNNADFDLTWFNQLITPFFISIGVSQTCHEAAHLVVSKKDGFKVSAPFILPAIALPYLSFQNNIKTSPKNLKSLFAFAAAGPAVGMLVSFGFLIIGLQMTLQMDTEALKYAPAVPVGFLQLSSLGANIVDYVIGGGDGLILQQDPNTPVVLHPFAIGGLCSLMINALDTIPIAGTDGGRMSHALLGRSGHSAFSGVMYVALIFYTLFSGHQDIFLTYLFMMSFAQKDLEIPCRNEVDNGNLVQAAIALTMWCVAILTLAPVN